MDKKIKSEHIVVEQDKYKIIQNLRKINLEKNAEEDQNKLFFDENDMLGQLMKNEEEIFRDKKIIDTSEIHVPINKGHFDLDTDKRKKEFEVKLGEDWEKDYKEYRKLWKDLGKSKKIRDYPLLVDLELSSVCNLHCPMCYTVTEDYIKKVRMKYMNHNVFQKVIDEIAGKVFAIRLSLRGESTLSKNFIDSV